MAGTGLGSCPSARRGVIIVEPAVSATTTVCACIILILFLIFRRDAALDDLAVKPITQFPVTLDDEV